MDVLILLLPIVLALIFVPWAYVKDKQEWNNGYCSECGGIWYSFDMDSSGARGYTCSCGRHIWVSYLREKPLDPHKLLL